VKQTAPAPQSALEVHLTNVQTSCTHALPSTVETHAHPVVPPAQAALQPVPPDELHVSAQVGTQNAGGTTQAPVPKLQTVPDGQQNAAPVGPIQQLVPGAQQTAFVGPEQMRLMSPPHWLHACMHAA
jgi:hypothetical protein